MKHLTLLLSDIDRLNSIQKRTLKQSLSEADKAYLSNFLSQIPKIHHLISEHLPLTEELTVNIVDLCNSCNDLDKWVDLFRNLPGWDYCPFCFLVDNDNHELLEKNVILIAWFAPSFSYNCVKSSDNRAYEVWLKDDGTAVFQLPTLDDAERYPEFYNFHGSWKEAYLLLIETLKKGWPIEEFPEELLPLLKK